MSWNMELVCTNWFVKCYRIVFNIVSIALSTFSYGTVSSNVSKFLVDCIILKCIPSFKHNTTIYFVAEKLNFRTLCFSERTRTSSNMLIAY